MTLPRVHLLVIRSSDIERLASFYAVIGLAFKKHAHGRGPEHYAAEEDGFVFDIYPIGSSGEPTIATRIGFEVEDVDATVGKLVEVDADIISMPRASPWGRRAVVKDFEGHTVELTATTGD